MLTRQDAVSYFQSLLPTIRFFILLCFLKVFSVKSKFKYTGVFYFCLVVLRHKISKQLLIKLQNNLIAFFQSNDKVGIFLFEFIQSCGQNQWCKPRSIGRKSRSDIFQDRYQNQDPHFFKNCVPRPRTKPSETKTGKNFAMYQDNISS